MAIRNRRREIRPREQETEACKKKFETTKLFAAKELETAWKKTVDATRGCLVTELTECFLGTFDPVFIRAVQSVVAFRLYGSTNVRTRKLKTMRHRLLNRVAVMAVTEARTPRKGRPSLRKALDAAAADYGHNETSFEAAKKCIEKAYRDYEKGNFPDGDTGGKLLVIDCSPGRELEAARSGIPYLVNDNTAARFAVFKGERIVLRRFYGWGVTRDWDATLAEASQPTCHAAAMGDDSPTSSTKQHAAHTRKRPRNVRGQMPSAYDPR